MNTYNTYNINHCAGCSTDLRPLATYYVAHGLRWCLRCFYAR